MAGRYLITGVQIGMLMALAHDSKNELLAEIEDKQYVGSSKRDILEDVATIAMNWENSNG